MTTQRVRFLESIDNPFLRITNEITQLQVQDARLHSNVLHLRQKIQSTRKQKICQSCKIFEDEISMLKFNEKQKISRLQQSIFALQRQNESLRKETYQIRQAQRERINASQNQVKSLSEDLKNKAEQYTVTQIIAYEQNILKDIEQKAVTLRLKQKRQRDLLRKLKNRRGSIKVTSELIPQIQSVPTSEAIIGHNKKTSSGNGYLQEPNYQDFEPLENISEILEKISSLEKQNSEIMKQLAQRDTEKQSSSMRIINLLGEIENNKKQLQNMDDFYKNQCAILEQERQRIVYELNMKLRNQQFQINNLKMCLQFSNREKDKIQYLKEIKQNQLLSLKKDNIVNQQVISTLRTAVIKLKEETEQLKKQNQSLKLSQQQSRCQLNAMSNDLKLASSKQLGKLKQLQLKQRQIQQLAYFNSQMHKDIEYFNNQNKILITKINDTDLIISDLELQNQKKIELLKKYEQQTTSLNSKIENANKQISILLNTCKESKIASDEQINSLKNTISELVLESDKMQHFFNAEQSTLKSLLNQSLEQKNRIIKQNEKLIKEINKKDIQNEELSTTNQKLNDRILATESTYKQSMQINVVNSVQKPFQNGLSLKDPFIDEQYSILQQKYEKSLDRIKSLESDENHYKDNNNYLTERVQNLTKALSESSQAENQQLLRELNKKKAMIAELLANFSFIEKQLKKKQSEFNDLSAKHERLIKNTQKDKHDLSEKLSSKQTQIVLLKRQREQANRLINQKQKQQQKLIQRLQQDNKVKDKQLAQQRKQKQRQRLRLADQKRKSQTSSSKQINNLREILQSQKKKSQKSSLNSSPAKFEDQKKKESDQLKKIINQNLIKIRSLEKKLKDVQNQKQQYQQSLKHAQNEIKQLTQNLAEVSVNLDIHKKQMQQLKMITQSLQKSLKVSQESKKIFLQKNEALESTLSLKQKQLLEFSHKFKRLDAKCQKLTNQNTQKDISYDCLWIQLDKAKSTVASLQKKINGQRQLKLTKAFSQQMLLQLPLQAHNIEDCSKLNLKISNIVQQEPNKESDENGIVEVMPKQSQQSCCQANPRQNDLIKQNQDHRADESLQRYQIVTLDKKEEALNEQLVAQTLKRPSAKRIILQGHGELSEAISEAQKNDEFNDISDRVSHHSSHVQRTLEEISQYSRIKSARSELTNKEIQDQYKSKMKNSKLLAKFKSSRKK